MMMMFRVVIRLAMAEERAQRSCGAKVGNNGAGAACSVQFYSSSACSVGARARRELLQYGGAPLARVVSSLATTNSIQIPDDNQPKMATDSCTPLEQKA